LINKILITTVFTALLLSPAWADKVILHEGKTITGKITQEDDNEVMIKVKGNMFLRVEKSKIKDIERTVKPVDTRPVVTLESVTKANATPMPTPTNSPVAAQPPAPAPAVTPTPQAAVSPVASPIPTPSAIPTKVNAAPSGPTTNVNEKVDRKGKLTLRVVTDADVQMVKEQPVGNECGVESKVMATWQGTPALEEGQAVWKNMVIMSSVTVRYLAVGSTRAKPIIPADIKAHGTAHAETYRNGLLKAGSKLANMRGANEAALREETERLFKVELMRIEKQIEGLDRRGQREAKPQPTPTSK
jgi:hypothetical protein